MLAELVAQGKLPPVDERLPDNPCVCPVLETTGKYGGTIRKAFNGMSDGSGPEKIVQDSFASYNVDLSVRASMAESWETNGDASVWTVHLRKGMKWSDGQPFTTADLMWWYENDLLNKELTRKPAANWVIGAEQAVMGQQAEDDYTITYSFAYPNPLFMYNLTSRVQPWGGPCHYLAQFHMGLTEDKAGLEAKVARAGFDSWAAYYRDRETWLLNPELPQLGPWVSVNTLADELFVMERNPYFWQVDEDGSQLPYVDRVQHRLFDKVDVFNLWILNGEIDFQGRHVELSDYTLFKEGEAKGGYRVETAEDDNTQVLVLNETFQEPLRREFFQNRNVRIAMSYALDRDAINDLEYNGLAKPRQYSPTSTSPQFYPPLTEAYVAYDPDKANELLDAEGYNQRGADGFRLWKDGSGPVSFIIESAQPSDAIEMISQYLNAVGINASLKIEERSLLEERRQANAYESEYAGASRAVLPILNPNFFLCLGNDKNPGMAWKLWREDPSNPNAEEPPEGHWVKKIWAIWDALRVEPDTTKHGPMFIEILKIHEQELPLIGTCGEAPAPIIVKQGLRNFPPGFHPPHTYVGKHDCLVPHQTYFWDEPDKH